MASPDVSSVRRIRSSSLIVNQLKIPVRRQQRLRRAPRSFLAWSTAGLNVPIVGLRNVGGSDIELIENRRKLGVQFASVIGGGAAARSAVVQATISNGISMDSSSALFRRQRARQRIEIGRQADVVIRSRRLRTVGGGKQGVEFGGEMSSAPVVRVRRRELAAGMSGSSCGGSISCANLAASCSDIRQPVSTTEVFGRSRLPLREIPVATAFRPSAASDRRAACSLAALVGGSGAATTVGARRKLRLLAGFLRDRHDRSGRLHRRRYRLRTGRTWRRRDFRPA